MLAVGSGEDDAVAAAREDADGEGGRAGSRLRAVGGVCVCVCVCVMVVVGGELAAMAEKVLSEAMTHVQLGCLAHRSVVTKWGISARARAVQRPV